MKRTEIVSVRLAAVTRVALQKVADAEHRTLAGYVAKLINSDLLARGIRVPVQEKPEKRGRPGVKRAREKVPPHTSAAAHGKDAAL